MARVLFLALTQRHSANFTPRYTPPAEFDFRLTKFLLARHTRIKGTASENRSVRWTRAYVGHPDPPVLHDGVLAARRVILPDPSVRIYFETATLSL